MSYGVLEAQNSAKEVLGDTHVLSVISYSPYILQGLTFIHVYTPVCAGVGGGERRVLYM